MLKLTMANRASQAMIPAICLVILAGCADERVVQVTREADNHQAQQNDQIARVVNEETAFRQEAAKLQRDLRADQAAIAQQRDQLEAERREAASWRQWAIFYTPILESLGVVAVVVAVLAYCGFLVHTLRNSGPADAVLTESLVDQILSVEMSPMLLPDEARQLPAPRTPASTAIIPLSNHD